MRALPAKPPAPRRARPRGLDARFEALRELVRLTRSLRAEFGVPPEARIRLALRFEQGFEARAFLEESGALIGLLAGGPRPERPASRPEGTVALVGRGFEAYAFVKESVDAGEAPREAAQGRSRRTSSTSRGPEPSSRTRASPLSAPAEVVAKEREKLEEAERRAGKYRQYLEELS